MKVCLYTESNEPSGVGEHMLTLAEALVPGYEVTVVAPPTPTGTALLERAAALGVGTAALSAPALEIRGEPLPAWVSARRFDVFHCHAGVSVEAHAGTLAAATTPVAVVRTEHQPDLLTRCALRREQVRVYSAAHRVIAVSDDVGASVLRGGAPPGRLRVVRNGIRVTAPRRSRSEARAELDVPDDVLLVVTVGRLRLQKGYHVLLEAVPDVVSYRPRTLFAWVGEGLLEALLAVRSRELGVASHVRLLGRRSDVRDVLAAADLFVLPSLWEGLPLSVLEAMAAGVPIVATDVCGTREAVRAGVTAHVVPAGDPSSLARAIIDLAGRPAVAAELAARAADRVASEFDARRMAAETVAVYQEAAAEGRRPGPRPIARHARSKAGIVRVGLLGAGFSAGRHVRALEGMDDVVVAAVADPVLARAEAVAAKCDADAYGSWEAVLDRDDIDALFLCVPPFAHGQIELAAIDRRLPFLVEKPLAADYATAERIAGAVADARLTTSVGYHWRYLDITERACSLVEQYQPVRLVAGSWLDAAPSVAWWGRQEKSGGQLVEQTTHIFDLARILAGEVGWVSAVDARVPRLADPEADVAATSVVTLGFLSGALGSVVSTSLLQWPHRIGLQVVCDALVVDLTEVELVVSLPDRIVYRAAVDACARQDRDFIDAVKGDGNGIRVPYGVALLTHRVASAAAASAISGERITLSAPPASPASSSRPVVTWAEVPRP